MTRRQLLSTLAAPAILRGQARKPNIVVLYADDLGWGDVGFNGRKEWSTPNLDRIAAQGTTFDRWYTAFPVCAPSRACLLTGRYTIHNTVRNNRTDLPSSETTIAEALKPLGYSTALFGKWHRGQLPDGGFTHPLDQGFDETFGYLDARHAWEHFPKQFWRGRESVPVSGYSCDLIADEAVKFLDRKRDNPFFLYLPFIEPHFHVEAPEENLAKYRGKFPEADPAKPVRAAYAAMIERLDAAIGRIVKAVDDRKLGDNTLIVFSSDNGATFESGNMGASAFHDSNRPFRGQKRSLEEGGIRMPSFVRWTGQVPAQRRSTEVVHMTDVFPSLLAAAGSTPNPAWQVDGVSVLDCWRGRAPAPDRTVFWEFQIEGGNMYAAMRGDFKLLEIGGNRFLYNVKDDPGERRTLGQVHPDIFKSLQADLKAWLATSKV